MANGWEIANRRKKAERLAWGLHKSKILAEQLPEMGDSDWELLAKLVHVKPPSDETKRMTQEILAIHERKIGF